MISNTFDTLKIAESFRDAGFDELQSRALAETFGTLALGHLVTREYLDFRLRELQLKLTLSLGGIITAILVFFKLMDRFF